MYNWAGVGWWLGSIKRPNGDKSKQVKAGGVRQPANFIILYTDDSEGPHCLTLEMYGQGDSVREAERWVMLERVTESQDEGREAEGQVEEDAEGVGPQAQLAGESSAEASPSSRELARGGGACGWGRARRGRGRR